MQWDARIGRRIKLRDLHIFLAVVEAGSMAKAGAGLAVSQPAVSKAIAEMEHVLGVPLLDRGSRGVEPTRYGRALVKRSLAVFDELKQGVKEIEYLSDPTIGELSIGSTEPLSAGLVTRVIDRLSDRYPLIGFQVTQGDPDTLLRRLDERAVDIVLARMPGRRLDENINAEILYEDSVVVAAGAESRWARRRRIGLADLLNERWVLYPPDSVLGLAVAKAFHDSGLEQPRAAVVTFSLSTRLSLLATGHFLSMLPASALRFSTRDSGVRTLPIDLPSTRQAIGLFTLKNRALSPVAQLFIDCVRGITAPPTERSEGVASA
jgi:DNA-binding transcriptional LysR family regulator